MRLLLDTHALVWWLTSDKQLGRVARTAIASSATQPWVSVASVWEAAIKSVTGRLRLPKPPDELLSDVALHDAGFQTMGIRSRHALIAAALPRDPRPLSPTPGRALPPTRGALPPRLRNPQLGASRLRASAQPPRSPAPGAVRLSGERRHGGPLQEPAAGATGGAGAANRKASKGVKKRKTAWSRTTQSHAFPRLSAPKILYGRGRLSIELLITDLGLWTLD